MGPPNAHGEGDDAALAALGACHPGGLIEFRPRRGDLAAALGLVEPVGLLEVALDILAVDEIGPAVNMVVLGRPPDRLRMIDRRRHLTVAVDGRPAFDGSATTVLVANGQFLRGLDVVPRGHPGDGRLEVQVYAVAPFERAGVRRRLATGTHLPHPTIHTHRAREVTVTADSPLPLEVDGVDQGRRARLAVTLSPQAFRLVL